MPNSRSGSKANVFGSMEGIPNSSEKTKLDLRSISESTIDQKKKISKQINFNIKKLTTEKLPSTEPEIKRSAQESSNRNNTWGESQQFDIHIRSNKQLNSSQLYRSKENKNYSDQMYVDDRLIIENHADESANSILSNSNHITSSLLSTSNALKDNITIDATLDQGFNTVTQSKNRD